MPHTRSIHDLLLLAASASLVLFAAPAELLAQPTGEERAVREWLESERARVARLPTTPLKISWEDHRVFSVPQAELKEIRAAIANKPDHPLKNTLSSWESHSVGKYSALKWIIWWSTPDEFRVHHAVENPSGINYELDRVSKGDAGWMLGSDYLATMGPELSEVTRSRTEFQYLVSDIVGSGLLEVTWDKVVPSLAYDQAKRRWRARYNLNNASLEYVDYLVLWDASVGRGVVQEKTRVGPGVVTEPMSPYRAVPSRWVYAGYKKAEGTDIWYASSIEGFNDRGEKCEVHRFVVVAALESEEFARVTAVPSAANPDPIRGWNDKWRIEKATPPEPQIGQAPGGAKESNHSLSSYLAVGVAVVFVVAVVAWRRAAGKVAEG